MKHKSSAVKTHICIVPEKAPHIAKVIAAKARDSGFRYTAAAAGMRLENGYGGSGLYWRITTRDGNFRR